MNTRLAEHIVKLLITFFFLGAILVVYLAETTIRLDDEICWSGKAVQWKDEAGLRCASREEAEWMSICPGGRIVRTFAGFGCEKKEE